MRSKRWALGAVAVVGLALGACSVGSDADAGATGDGDAVGTTTRAPGSTTASAASATSSSPATSGDGDGPTATATGDDGEPSDPAQLEVLAETAERFISTTIADQFGAALEPSCPDVAGTTAGTTFSCTATTPDGRLVELDATIEDGDNLNVVTTNVVLARFLPDLERVGVEVLAGAGAEILTIECGTASVVLDESQEMVCSATEADGTPGSVTYLIEDTRTGDFEIRVN